MADKPYRESILQTRRSESLLPGSLHESIVVYTGPGSVELPLIPKMACEILWEIVVFYVYQSVDHHISSHRLG